MGIFERKPDRYTKHHRTDVQIHGRKSFDTGREITDRYRGRINAERKELEKTIYRKFRGYGWGFFESRRKAKLEAAKIMLNRYQKPRRRKKRR